MKVLENDQQSIALCDVLHMHAHALPVSTLRLENRWVMFGISFFLLCFTFFSAEGAVYQFTYVETIFFLSCAQLVNENYTCEICELKLYGATSKQQKRSVNARLVLAATKYKSSAVAIELRYPTLNAITIYLKKNMNTEGLQFAQF